MCEQSLQSVDKHTNMLGFLYTWICEKCGKLVDDGWKQQSFIPILLLCVNKGAASVYDVQKKMT